jgi:two-component system, cell cycle sensor histidine kinase and response regulator CckA
MSALSQPQPKLLSPEPRTEQPPAEAQRMEALGRLVSGVAHDFNNLLTGIVLCSDLLLAGLEEGSPLRRYAKEIRSASAQSAGMIRQLLASAKPGADEAAFVSLNDAVLGLRNWLSRLIGENVELVTELANDLRRIRTDPAQLQQIILNLILNARDAMPDGGRIKLSTRNCASLGNESQPGFVEFEVRDEGCGMDAETCSRAFEPFFTTKKIGKGTGLGLSTVHGIVKRQGGTIEIESEPGRGTGVIVRLPAADAPVKLPRTKVSAVGADLDTSSQKEVQTQEILKKAAGASL